VNNLTNLLFAILLLIAPKTRAGFEGNVPTADTLTQIMTNFSEGYFEQLSRGYVIREGALNTYYYTPDQGVYLNCEVPFSVSITRNITKTTMTENLSYSGCKGHLGNMTLFRRGQKLEITPDAELLYGMIPDSAGLEEYKLTLDWVHIILHIQRTETVDITTMNGPQLFYKLEEHKNFGTEIKEYIIKGHLGETFFDFTLLAFPYGEYKLDGFSVPLNNFNEAHSVVVSILEMDMSSPVNDAWPQILQWKSPELEVTTVKDLWLLKSVRLRTE